MSAIRKIPICKHTLLLLLWLFAIKGIAFGQCVNQVRTYATIQQTNAGLLTSVDNAASAVDGNPKNFSKLNRLLGLGLGSVTQYLKFNTPITIGTPVTVKLSLPSSLLSLLAGVEVQPFTNLHDAGLFGWQADAAGDATTNASLLGLINGAGDMEITIVPKSGAVPVLYEGVWVRLTGVAVAQSLSLFHAYIKTDASGNMGCSTPVDILAGTMAGTVVGGIANATGTVINKWDAIDTDPTFSTYAELNVGAQVLSKVYHTTIFNVVSRPGDFVRMVLQNPGGGLLDLSVLSGFTIQLYNGSVPSGLPISSNSGLLSLSLLPSTTDKYQLDLVPPASVSFDRIEVQMGGLADVSLTQGLRIYDVKRMIATPATNIDGVALSTKAVCAGNTATLSINNAQLCTTYNWYDAAIGGNLLGTGTSYTPSAASLSAVATNWFYVDAARNGCSEVTTRTPVSITLNPLPAVITATTPPICSGVISTAITYTATNAPITYSIAWNGAALTAGFTDVTNAALLPGEISVVVPANAPGATYNGIITVKNINGCLSSGKPFSITVDAKPTQPQINLTP